MVLYLCMLSNGDLLPNPGEGHQGYGKVNLPKDNITWSLAPAGNGTQVAELASHMEYHYNTDPPPL